MLTFKNKIYKHKNLKIITLKNNNLHLNSQTTLYFNYFLNRYLCTPKNGKLQFKNNG